MSKRYDDELFHTLSETKRLVGDTPVPAGEEFSLESILAEFGQGAAEPADETVVAEEEELRRVPETKDEKSTPVQEQEEEKPPVSTEEAAPEEDTTKPEKPEEHAAAPRRGKVLQFPRIFVPREKEEPAREETPTVEENVPEQTEEVPAEPAGEETDKPVEESIEESAEEPTPADEQRISIEDVMARTVDAVLEDEEDAILDDPVPLAERLSRIWSGCGEKLRAVVGGLLPTKTRRREEEEIPREPDMEQAERESKRRCKKLRRQLLLASLPLLALLVITVADTWTDRLGAAVQELLAPWFASAMLRCAVPGGLLLLVCAACVNVWREAFAALKARRFNAEAASLLPVLAVAGECIYGAAVDEMIYLPLAAPAALLVWLCLLGQLLWAKARHDAFRLAYLGGQPPYAVSVTAAGACKQRGELRGFYTAFHRADPVSRSQTVLLPLLLSAATVLSGVVCIGGERMDEFFRVWSAMLTASLPLGLPLCGALSVNCLTRRLRRSGCAVAGYSGAETISGVKRIVLTDGDLFPPGTVSLNGLKLYGEEIGKVVSYAATVCRAAGSQLQPIFEQLLSTEGGSYCRYEDLHFYEEGGASVTIHGETVAMGSAYFMKKQRVTLPHELKVKTGVFLAVDGQLIAIFAIKYRPSRNVEWALRALRRSRIEPVLAVRSGNITPGLLKRKFRVDVKPLYPDISTRLALSDLSGEKTPGSGAVIYREGLMPFAETVIGSRRCCAMVKRSGVLCALGSLCGLLLAYYLTGVAAYDAISAGYVLIFALLWLLPVVLLGDLTRRY